MAAVLSAEESDYFRPNTSLRRSHSHTQFASPSTPYHDPISKSSATPTPTHPASYQPSESSSTSSSPRTIHAESADLSYASTPATAFSVLSDYEESLSIDDAPEDHFSFPSYAQEKFLLQPGYHQDDGLPPPSSPQGGDPAADSTTPDNGDAEGPDTPDCSEHAEDDTAVVSRPSRQVDYLSHEWKEEDIWSSWRYVVSRRGEFSNSARLENASWRTWMKAKNNLRTISPETLNWLKDCDVTWLYGPLQTGPRKVNTTHTEPSSQVLSKSDSLVNLNKKPILKKRSMSEMMLQRSLSTASLLKQAAAAVQAQETRSSLRPGLARSNTDYTTFAFSARRSSHGTFSSVDPSVDSSSLASPSVERRHIHFNEQVEQCIAVEVKGDDEDDIDHDWYGKDSDSDDGFMMKRTRTKKRKPVKRRGTKKSSNADGKIIAMLPSTTLKYREDTPEPQETAMKHSTGNLRNSLLSPSPSDETLRPSKESTKFFFGEEDDTQIEDSILNSKPGWRSPPFEGPSGGPHRSTSSGSLTEEPMGMRRTESGMLMPCEEAEAATSGSGDGIFGRVVDTVNTARDIAHVIWNVGWRK